MPRFWSRNIWFLCPSCGQKLVVDHTAAGYRADCPHCRRNIPIPLHSTATPGWFKTAALYATHVLLLAGGIGGGLWYAGRSAPTETPSEPERTRTAPVAAAPAAVAPDAPATEAPAQAINQELMDENIALKGKYDKMAQWVLDNFRGKYPLPERLVARLRITPMDESLAVNGELAEILRMTDEEKALVQDVFNFVRTSITEAELDRALITEQDDNKITLSIPTYPEVGEGLREDLYMTLEDTLGAARFDRMMDVTGPEMDQQFHYFGQASRTLTFEVIHPQPGETFSPYLLIRDGWIVPDGESVRLTKVTETAVTELPASYKAYQPHIPETVIRYATP